VKQTADPRVPIGTEHGRLAQHKDMSDCRNFDYRGFRNQQTGRAFAWSLKQLSKGSGTQPQIDMPKLPLLFAVVGLSCAFTMFAQPLPSTVPLSTRAHEARVPIGVHGFSWVFDLKGKKYRAEIDQTLITAGPDWAPTQPLPLKLGVVEESARAELRKLIKDDSTWEVTEINLRRLQGDLQTKWYLVVRMMPKVREPNVIPDSFYLPVALSGEVGAIKPGSP